MRIILVIFFILSGANMVVAQKSSVISQTEQQSLTFAEQFYNRLVVSSRIVKFTNKYIDSKKKENPQVSESVWQEIKNKIDYSFFEKGAVEVLRTNLSEAQMQKLLKDFEHKPYVPIPSLKIKKELYELTQTFSPTIEKVISSVIAESGY